MGASSMVVSGRPSTCGKPGFFLGNREIVRLEGNAIQRLSLVIRMRGDRDVF